MTDEEKLEALRQAIKEGFDAIDQCRYTTLKTREDLKAFMESVSATPKQSGGRRLSPRRPGTNYA